MAAPVVTKAVLEATGRELGPDLALKFDGIAAPITNASVTGMTVGGAAGGYDVSKFNITEVLNVIAYTSNATRDATALDIEHSAVIPTYDGIAAGGVYANAGGVTTLAQQATAGAHFDTLYVDAAAPIFDFANLNYNTVGAGGLLLPQCLLKRSNTAAPVVAPPNANMLLNPLAIAAVGGAPPVDDAAIRRFIGDVLLQGLHILHQTRSIFGPKGWTALFSQVKGGGGKNHAKRTHRQHRRKYSSKQY